MATALQYSTPRNEVDSTDYKHPTDLNKVAGVQYYTLDSQSFADMPDGSTLRLVNGKGYTPCARPEARTRQLAFKAKLQKGDMESPLLYCPLCGAAIIGIDQTPPDCDRHGQPLRAGPPLVICARGHSVRGEDRIDHPSQCQAGKPQPMATMLE